jgi:hypothetical protein
MELLSAGVPPEVMAHLRGWSSLAFLLYWWKVKLILSMNISDAYRWKWEELSLELEAFHIRNNIPKDVALAQSE